MPEMPTISRSDDGCSWFGTCVECRLEVCWFDMSVGARRDYWYGREVILLYDNAGLTIDDIQERLGISRSSVVRILRSLRARGLVGSRREPYKGELSI